MVIKYTLYDFNSFEFIEIFYYGQEPIQIYFNECFRVIENNV